MLLARYMPDTESPPLTIIKEMKEIFFRLGFSQTVAIKLVDDQAIVSPWILASLSDEDIATICDGIRRLQWLSEKEDDRQGNQISDLEAKNLMFTVFMFK